MSVYAVIFPILVLMSIAKSDKLQIVEEQPPGTEIPSLTFYLKSLLRNKSTKFQLIEDNALSRSISVNSETGNVTVKSPIDRESLCQKDTLKCVIQLRFLLSQQNLPITIDMEIIDINDNDPKWPQQSITRDVIEFEGKRNDNFFISVEKAIDPDCGENGTVSYFLTESDGVTKNADFKIQNNYQIIDRLALYPVNDIDREKTSSYFLVLLAKDHGTPRRTGSLRINVNVIDRNDNSPICEKNQYRFNELSETTKIGTIVLKVLATDNDLGENGRVSYRIDDRVASKYFDIDSKGQITVKERLDYDHGQKNFNFNVQVADNAPEAYRKTGECNVFITLKDENDEKPEILIHLTTKDPVTNEPTIKENEGARNFVLAHIQVKDPDYRGTDHVRCTLSVNKHMMLVTSPSNNNEHQIVALSSFDREESAKERVDIVCTDQAHNRASKSIVFQIIDENDNAPIFGKEFRFSVKENSTNPIMIVGDVRAEDKDEGLNGKVSYSIEGDSEYFRIDTRGRIYTKRVLDREEFNRFNLTVLGKDGGQPQLTGTTRVVIDVVDVNDWPPEFSATSYEFNVKENSRIGSLIGVVIATDRDVQSNTFMKYKISPKDASRVPFKIVQKTEGEIVTKQPLDREFQNLYVFTVVAEDNGRPESLTSFATVRVTVLDVNDNTPVFLTNNHTKFQFDFTEPVGYDIGHVQATDADAGHNSILEYRIIAGNPNKYFDLNSDTGKINLVNPIIRAGDKKLVIEACDKGVPKLCSGPLWVTMKVTKNAKMGPNLAGYDSQTESKTFIFIIIILVILLLIILILVIVAFLFKSRVCLPVPRASRSNSGDIRTIETNNTKKSIDGRFYSNCNIESMHLSEYPMLAPTGSMVMRNQAFDSPMPLRERQVSSDYQSIDGGSPRYNHGTTFNWDVATIQPTIHEADPVYIGHRNTKDYYYPASSVPFNLAYSTYTAHRYRSPNYGINMTDLTKEADMTQELPLRNSCQKPYSSLLNFDSAMSNQDNYNYKSLRKPPPKASFV